MVNKNGFRPVSRRETFALFSAGIVGAAMPLVLADAPLPAGAGLASVSAQQGKPLGEIAAAAGILFGASIGHDIPADYAELYVREARILTTDRALKFDFLRPGPDRFNFEPADGILAFADVHKIPLRGHTLVWNENPPAWLKSLSGRELEKVFDAHIEKVASRYAGRLHSWDVVNEPFWPQHGTAGGYRDGPWFSAMGAAYVPRAFKRVHAIDKDVRLCLNEAHCELDNDWGRGIRPRLLGLIDSLLDQGIPLKAVGLQGHLVPEWGSNADMFHGYLVEVAKRGVDIYITELDISDMTFPTDPAARDAAVAAGYADFLRKVLTVPNVKVVETWQLADKYSWYRDREIMARPLPFDDSLRPKKARDAIAEAFRQRVV